MAKYDHVATFKATMHHIYLQARMEPDRQWFPLPFRVEDEEIDKVISEWEESWRPSIEGINTPVTTATKKTTPTVTPGTVPTGDIRKNKDKHVAGTTPGQSATQETARIETTKASREVARKTAEEKAVDEAKKKEADKTKEQDPIVAPT